MSLGIDILNYVAPADEHFVRPVACPEIAQFDKKLFVRKVSAKELDAVVAGDDDVNSRARYAVLFASNDRGQRIWGDHQTELLGSKPHLLFLIERINHHGRLHNGLTEESRQLVQKNCESGEESGSPASSAAPVTPAAGSTGGD